MEGSVPIVAGRDVYVFGTAFQIESGDGIVGVNLQAFLEVLLSFLPIAGGIMLQAFLVRREDLIFFPANRFRVAVEDFINTERFFFAFHIDKIQISRKKSRVVLE